MDRVRFGRALGYGARHAGKAIWSALDAATASDPRAAATPADKRPSATSGVRQNATIRQAAPRFGTALKSVKKFSSVVSLQVAGTFYAIFAAALAAAVWKQRQWFAHRVSPVPQAIFLALPLCALFAYFAVSSFVRANRRQRK